MGKSARAVKRAAKRAETIHAEIYGQPAGSDADPDTILDGLNNDGTPGTPNTPPVEPVEPPAEPAEPALTVVPNEDDPITPAEPVDPVVPDEPVDPPAEPAATDLLTKAEHKYSVLQGMHRKMLDENNDLRSRLGALEAAPIAPIEPSPLPPGSSVTAEDVEDYGSDLIDMVKRAAHEEISPQLAKLEAENAQLRNQLTGVTSNIDARAKGDVYGTLATEVANWEQINNSDEFLFWLAQQDPFSGERRHDLLTQAFKTNDSARVVTFFKAFLSEDTAVTPPQPAAATPAAPVQPKVDLVSMAAPGRAQAAGQPSNQADTRTYTRAEIQAHYKSVQLGKFTGTQADKTRIEKDFVTAANEGRVL